MRKVAALPPAHQSESPSIESMPGSGSAVAPANGNVGSTKVILSTFDTLSTSLLAVNLLAVAVGTFKVLLWATVITLTIVGGFIGGMIRASARRGRRSF